MGKKYRLLSLDGGGSWAIIQVKTLIGLYGLKATGHEVLADFDLIAANSGGSLVVAGLIENFTLEKILTLFQDKRQREQIFARLPWYKKLTPSRILAKFSTIEKHKALVSILPSYGSALIKTIAIKGNNDCDVKILFCAYDYDRDRARFLRSWQSKTASITSTLTDISLVDAIHASTNAPIEYFDEPAKSKKEDDTQYWDGGLTGYNNPVLAAVTEAIALQWPKDQIAVLSIGTGNTMLPLIKDNYHNDLSVLFKAKQTSGLRGDLKKVATTILADPPDSHTFIAHLMLDGQLPTSNECPFTNTSIVRLNPLIQPDGNSTLGWKLPKNLNAVEFERLVNLDMAAIEPNDVSLIIKFCDLWMQNTIKNQPIRAGKDFICEIGFSSYGEAVKHWKSN